MHKEFRIKKIEQEQLTDTTGSIVFHIVDENGYERTVNGSTFLNADNEAQAVSTESIRELPLIENLFSNRHKERIEVEFENFNRMFDRETNSTVNKKAYEAVKKMQEENKLARRLSNLFSKKRSTLNT